MAAICNRDCFNCIHPDCILPDTPEGRKKRWSREYYEKNKEILNELSARYQKEHREHCNALARKRRAEDPEKYRAYCRKYYREHREKILENKRRRYQEKKAALKAAEEAKRETKP